MAEKAWTPVSILRGVTAVLVDALGLEEEEVFLNSRIEPDLGAESIDFLDIHFRMANRFDIHLNHRPSEHLQKILQVIWIDLLPAEERMKQEEELLISKEESESLKTKFPFIAIKYKEGTSIKDVVTVEFYCKFIAAKLGVPWITPNIPATT